MRFAKNSNVLVKIALAVMLIMSVLITGCTGDDKEAWDKTYKAFVIEYSDLVEFYKIRATQQVDLELSKWDEFQKDTFYLSREQMLSIEDKFEKLKKMAKDKKERQKLLKGYYSEVDNAKKEIIAKGKASRIVPKEHLNFDKDVNVPKVEPNKTYRDFRNGKLIKAVYPKNYNGSKEKVEPKNEESKKSPSKQTSAVEKKEVENKGNIGVITGTEVRFRQAGNLNSKILGYFNKGEKVTVLAKENGWSKVQRQDGSIGYVSNDFCK